MIFASLSSGFRTIDLQDKTFFKDIYNVKPNTFIKISLLGIVSAFLGNFIRSFKGGGNSINSSLDALSLVLGRLFVNNSLIYVGQSRFEKLNSMKLLECIFFDTR